MRSLLVSLALAIPLTAATFQVTKTIDDNGVCTATDCSLRGAIIAANNDRTATAASPHIITVPPGTYVLTIDLPGFEDLSAEGDLDIRNHVTIRGAGAASTTVDAGWRAFDSIGIGEQVFDVPFNPSTANPPAPGFKVRLERLTIRGGGGGFNTLQPTASAVQALNGNDLTLLECVVEQSRDGEIMVHYQRATGAILRTTVRGPGSSALGTGGVFNNGPQLLIDQSTISGHARNGIMAVSGLAAVTTIIRNSTISGNDVGLYGEARQASAVATNTTFANNGWDIYSIDFAPVTLKSSILSSSVPCVTGGALSITSAGYNVVRAFTRAGQPVCFTAQTTDQTDVPATAINLGPLGANGGPTETQELLTGSVAIDRGTCVDATNATLTTDQRGAARPQDGDGNGSLLCDAGSYERTASQNAPPAVTILAPPAGATYAVGDWVDYKGSARDAAGNLLSASIRWRATVVHDNHQHTDVITLVSPAESGSFRFPAHAQNAYVVLCARATDSRGLSTEVCRDIRPRQVAYTLNTAPQGLQIIWDGVTRTAPFTVNATVNSQVDVSAPSPQQVCRRFVSWSDGYTSASRRLLIGSAGATLTAAFDSSQCGSPGLLGYWKFDEGGGSTSSDSSGNGNAAVLSNAGWTAQGHPGPAVNFIGSAGSHVRINGSPSLNSATAQITVTAWAFKHTNRASWSTVASRQLGSARDNQWYLSFLDGKPAFGVNTVGTGDQNVTAAAVPDVKQWVHLAGTYDGATLRLYANGVLVASRAKTGTLLTDNNPLLVGANQNGTLLDLLFNGRVDELRVYSRALSAAEIAAVYNGAP